MGGQPQAALPAAHQTNRTCVRAARAGACARSTRPTSIRVTRWRTAMMIVYRRMILNSLLLVPGMQRLQEIRSPLRKRHLGTGGSSSARYCYSVWLRHLSMAARLGLNTDPKDVAELGPGHSIGVGLAALLSGA